MYNLLPREIIQCIYDYDNTYQLEFNKIVDICKSKFDKYFITNKGIFIYIYDIEEFGVSCISYKTPVQFYKKFYELKIYLLENKEYSKNWVVYNENLGIETWLNSDNINLKNLIIEKLILKY